MTDHLFTAQVIKKTFPEWTDFSCVHMSITLNIAYKAGLIRPPEEKISESPCAPVEYEVGSESPLQVPPHQRIEKMSYEDQNPENEFTFDADYTAKCINSLIESVLNPENLHKIGIAAAKDLKYKYEQEGHIPDGEQQDTDLAEIVADKITRQIGV